MKELPEGIRRQVEGMIRSIKDDRRYVGEPPDAAMDSDLVTVFIARMCHKAGMKWRIRVVGDRGEKFPNAAFHHCFVEVYYPFVGAWITLDPLQANGRWQNDVVVPAE